MNKRKSTKTATRPKKQQANRPQGRKPKKTKQQNKTGRHAGKLEVIPLGGFSEVGRNCVAVKVRDENGEDVFILDLGLAIDKYIEYTEQEGYDQVRASAKKLMEIGAAPDVTLLGKDQKNVKSIILSHAHLDHILAVPYLANRFNCPLYATPFTAELVRTITSDEKMPLRDEVITKVAGDRWKLTDNVECEFVHMTHSTPQTVAVVLHTKHGRVIYAPDYKFDEHPTKGEKSDTKRLKELRGSDVLICDALYAHKNEKVPSENYARSMLFNVLSKEKTEGKIIIATTFASSVYRLQTLMEVAQKLGRKTMFLGRSMGKYIDAAEYLGIADFGDAEVVRYGSKVRSALKRIRNPEKYFFICTGNQGEPKAVLSKIVTRDWLPFEAEDMIVFSCITIPVEPNITYRRNLEEKMKRRKLEVLTNIHVSGHGAVEDHRRMMKLVRPKHVIPMHGELHKLFKFKQMAMKEFKMPEQNVHIMANGERLILENGTSRVETDRRGKINRRPEDGKDSAPQRSSRQPRTRRR